MNRMESQPLIVNDAYPNEYHRENEKLGPISTLGRVVSSALGILCCPFTCCCSITNVRPQEQVINSYWNVPAEILRKPGIYWRSCFGLSQVKISTALSDTKINKWKVNDSEGSPIKISAVIQWKPQDAIKVAFNTNGQASAIIADQALATLR